MCIKIGLIVISVFFYFINKQFMAIFLRYNKIVIPFFFTLGNEVQVLTDALSTSDLPEKCLRQKIYKAQRSTEFLLLHFLTFKTIHNPLKERGQQFPLTRGKTVLTFWSWRAPKLNVGHGQRWKQYVLILICKEVIECCGLQTNVKMGQLFRFISQSNRAISIGLQVRSKSNLQITGKMVRKA